MIPIQMVDTKKQYEKIKEEVDSGIHEVLNSAAYINGKPVKDFAVNLANYLGAKHVIPCANGTDALQIALMALGLEPGDEVIVPSFTYIATTEVIALLRLQAVFVEVDEHTFCIDPSTIEKAITPKTKAIVPVHLYGQAANMEQIMEIATKHNLFVVEDNAQAIGSVINSANNAVKTGTIGHIGCTSFYPSKNLGCYGDGGAMCTNDDALAEKLQMIANHGQKLRYYHDVVGCNSRLDSIQAVVLNAKLKKLDEYNTARIAVATFYDEQFKDIKELIIPARASYGTHVFHQYTLRVTNGKRNQMQTYLAEHKVPSMIYYPVPAHKQGMFAQMGGANFNLPLTDLLCEQVISLPVHTEMDNEQLQYIANTVKNFFKNA
jgi:UDP-2-acetamido-2-deoxy-ribo-hexuluronate aminotransferase